ncbi:acyl-CoA synthetase [Tardibacter chloracetimidivorans]|uniref:Acyl-CoA synthetase n=1 Tax=Tardibacter chloracetimidivorans TaxID=1921510 RepID=A0A1L3ZSM8_9SPHN|nr:AMP-binding protein [Tardibacter chloracetimidivorans]API58643.1 acyl-CoA synthetase [Tardibacter chloracetimidivorans]
MVQPFDIPTRYNFARDDFERIAHERPDDRALLWIGGDGQVEDRSFSEMSLAGARAASLLAAWGVRRGDTVLILLSRELAWWELMLGCLRLGAIASPGTIQLKAKDIAYRRDASGARCIIASADVADAVDAAWDGDTTRIIVGSSRAGWTSYDEALVAADPFDGFADTGSDEDAFCYFSSGTTGQPKMAVHGHSYALAHRITGSYWLGLGSNDLHWNVSDNGWAKAAWSSLFGPWQQGAAIFTHQSRSFDPAASLDMLERFPITTLCAPPTAYRMFVRSNLKGRTFAALRHCVSAGEPLNPEVIELWSETTGLVIHDGYGQTETVLLCGNRPGASRSGSMGKPAPQFDMAVVDEEGAPMPAGKEGDIALRAGEPRPPGLFKGYRGEAALNESVFRNGWYLTGDRAVVDEDGYFWFVGRADDVILTAGYRIGPFEVESALFEHPAVAESAVVASPDKERGEVIKAFVVLAAGYQASPDLVKILQDHVKATTAPYKYPRRIEFVDSLPKTISGKIRRKELRDAEWGRLASA